MATYFFEDFVLYRKLWVVTIFSSSLGNVTFFFLTENYENNLF